MRHQKARTDTADEPETVLTAMEAADLARMGRTAFYRLLKHGNVPGVQRVGGRYRVVRSVFMAWLSGEKTA